MERTGRGGKMKKERRFFNAKEKKKQLGISLILLFLLGIGFGWLANMDGLYLSWKKAFYAAEEARGYGPSEKILLVQEEKTEGWRQIGNAWNPFHTPIGESRYLVGRLPQTEEEGYLSIVKLLKTFPCFWYTLDGEEICFQGKAEAYFDRTMWMILGSCQERQIAEIFMEWGYRMEDGGWDMLEESIVPVTEDGFFYFALPKEEYGERMNKGMWNYRREGDHLRYGMGVKYLEGRNAAGEVIYQKWMDDTGRFVEIDPKK